MTLILSHFGATIPFIYQRLDDGFKGFPMSGEHHEAASEYFKRFYYDTATPLPSRPSCAPTTWPGPEKIVFGRIDPYARNRLIEIKMKQLGDTWVCPRGAGKDL